MSILIHTTLYNKIGNFTRGKQKIFELFMFVIKEAIELRNLII